MASKKRNPARAESAGLGNVHLDDDAPRNTAPRRTPQADVAEIYDGLRRVGLVERRAQVFRAMNADGKRLGDFSTERDAMRAVTQAAGGRL
jgi:hypothetical protein